jgi:hypothetical protein
MVEALELNSLRTQTRRSGDVLRSARPRQTSRLRYWPILNDPEIGAGPYTGPPCYSPGPATSIGKAAASMLHVDAAAVALNLIGPAGALSETRCEPVFHDLDIPTWVIGGGGDLRSTTEPVSTLSRSVLGHPGYRLG